MPAASVLSHDDGSSAAEHSMLNNIRQLLSAAAVAHQLESAAYVQPICGSQPKGVAYAQTLLLPCRQGGMLPGLEGL